MYVCIDKKKKATKMSLSEFLRDDNTGSSSWADDLTDLPTARKSLKWNNIDMNVFK